MMASSDLRKNQLEIECGLDAVSPDEWVKNAGQQI